MGDKPSSKSHGFKGNVRVKTNEFGHFIDVCLPLTCLNLKEFYAVPSQKIFRKMAEQRKRQAGYRFNKTEN